MSNTATVNYKWSSKGKQPPIKQKQSKRERVTIFGAVNTVSGEFIAKKAEKGNTITFKRFLKKILHQYKNNHGKIHIVLDNVRYHHAKKLKPFLEKNKDKISLIFLPPYSPDLNPVERVWWYMRKKITHNRYTTTLYERLKVFWKLMHPFNTPNDFIKNLCNISYSV